jgi:hypothetical protein
MKFSFTIRHLLALMLLVGVMIQAYHAYQLRRRVEWPKHGVRWGEERLRKAEESRRYEHELCKQVVDAYEYPVDYEAAERRFAQLKSDKAQGD